MLTTRPTLLCILLLLLSPATMAEIYKWQDEDGIWHFSNQPPPEEQASERIDTPVEPQPMVSMRKAGADRAPIHYFTNHYHGPAQIELRVVEKDNIRSDPPLPAWFELPPRAEQRLVQFRPDDRNLGFRYRLAYSLVPGPVLTNIPQDLNYYPPFPEGQAHAISQGLDDASTHTDAANRYAVDIAMPIGTPILAARGGIIMNAEDRFTEEGMKDPKFLHRANVVRILHDDGSMAVYAHLDAHSVRVRPGQRVPTGHWIADSGNTGFSSGPHLHLVVQMNIGMALESLPFQFRLPDGGIMDPDHSQMLRGVLPLNSP